MKMVCVRGVEVFGGLGVDIPIRGGPLETNIAEGFLFLLQLSYSFKDQLPLFEG